MTLQHINLRDIRLDGGTQPRVEIDNAVVSEYHEAFVAGATMPPLSVYFDGASYWLADGFHRLHALRRLGAVKVECQVTDGTQQDAVIAACAANAHHGLRRTNADKRKAVEMMLAAAADWSDRKIAAHVGVTHPFVAAIRSHEVAEKQKVAAKAKNENAKGGNAFHSKTDAPKVELNSTAAAPQQPGKGVQAQDEAPQAQDEDADMAAQIEREMLAEQTAMRQIFEADDRLAEALALIKQKDAVIDGLNQRLFGMTNELAEAKSIINSLKRKLAKVEA